MNQQFNQQTPQQIGQQSTRQQYYQQAPAQGTVPMNPQSQMRLKYSKGASRSNKLRNIPKTTGGKIALIAWAVSIVLSVVVPILLYNHFASEFMAYPHHFPGANSASEVGFEFALPISSGIWFLALISPLLIYMQRSRGITFERRLQQEINLNGPYLTYSYHEFNDDNKNAQMIVHGDVRQLRITYDPDLYQVSLEGPMTETHVTDKTMPNSYTTTRNIPRVTLEAAFKPDLYQTLTQVQRSYGIISENDIARARGRSAAGIAPDGFTDAVL